MKTLPEVPDNSDLTREVEALRKRIEALESGRAHPKVAGGATRWRRLASKPALALTAVMGAVLALGVLSAQNKPDPLLIDPNGTVSIGSARFSKIAVNQIPQSGQTMIITADGTEVPFNVTDKSNTVNWLTVFKDGNVAMNGGNVVMNGGKVGIGTTAPGAPLQIGNSSEFAQDARIRLATREPQRDGTNRREWSLGVKYGGRDTTPPNYGFTIRDEDAGTTGEDRMVIGFGTGYVGIGKPNPAVPLDVKGEIRGKPWTSKEYEWTNSQPGTTTMTKVASSVCFLTYVESSFSGHPVKVGIANNNGFWVLGGASNIPAKAKAVCIGAPDDSW